MINKLHIKGLKSLKDVEIDIAPLTVLTGINSSGKSTVIQALRMLYASCSNESPYLKNYGTFDDLLYRNEGTEDLQGTIAHISIELQVANSKQARVQLQSATPAV